MLYFIQLLVLFSLKYVANERKLKKIISFSLRRVVETGASVVVRLDYSTDRVNGSPNFIGANSRVSQEQPRTRRRRRRHGEPHGVGRGARGRRRPLRHQPGRQGGLRCPGDGLRRRVRGP